MLLAETHGTLFCDGEMVDFAFQALKLILQPDSEDDLEVDYYESSNESVEDEDFAEDVPKIDGNPEYETNKDGELNNDQMSRLCVASNMLW